MRRYSSVGRAANYHPGAPGLKSGVADKFYGSPVHPSCKFWYFLPFNLMIVESSCSLPSNAVCLKSINSTLDY